MQVKAHKPVAAKKHNKKVAKKSPAKRAFHTTTPQHNPRRDKLAEAVLNVVKPTVPEWQKLSTKPVSTPGTYMLTGADLAPVGTQSLEDNASLDNIDNVIPYSADCTPTQRHLRQLFFNTFPRQSALPAGPILQTAYTNYSIYKQPIDWAKKMPGVLARISIKEKPDYTNQLDTRWYKEALPRPKARVEIHMRSLKFLTKLEQNILGEILGPRYNWKTGRIVMSVQNLRDRHANINRCFQYLHEAAFRAIEIAPHIAEQNSRDRDELNRQNKQVAVSQKKLQASLTPFTTHKKRPAMPTEENMERYITLDDVKYIPFDKTKTPEEHVALFKNQTGEYTLGGTTWDEAQVSDREVEEFERQFAEQANRAAQEMKRVAEEKF